MTIKPQRSFFFSLGVGSTVVVAIAACSLGDVDITNKACPCGPGYACDTTRNVCVTTETALTNAADAGCKGDTCPCSVDGECTDSARARCSLTTKLCVECVATNDTCGPGSYCNESNQCTLGCKKDSDCQIAQGAPHCELNSHRCVGCSGVADCTGGKVCSPSGDCTETCDPTAGTGCSNGRECCGGFCIDTASDPLNCGACNTACSKTNGTPKCIQKACTWTCANGFSHCAPPGQNTGCETNTRSDSKHCGSCTTDCAGAVKNASSPTCTAGACGFNSCNLNFGDCDNDPKNGCECSCGAAKGDRCCPGSIPCNFNGGKCVGSGNCQ